MSCKKAIFTHTNCLWIKFSNRLAFVYVVKSFKQIFACRSMPFFADNISIKSFIYIELENGFFFNCCQNYISCSGLVAISHTKKT